MNTIQLNFDNFKDKVLACWIGKNIGGTMGTPYERTRGFKKRLFTSSAIYI